jgi:Galactose oxidase, central domain
MKKICISFSLLFFVFCLMVFSKRCNAQQWQTQLLANAPEPITNTAISYANDKVYVFGGLDSSKLFSGIHQRSYVFDITNNTWQSLPNLPDTLGKIAAAASQIKNIIYVAGGYQVAANGAEVSSNNMHRFNVTTNLFISDAASIPTPIDDQVQAVWRDSLLYIITGWSNTASVPAVQIYNPTTNSWTSTTTPNTAAYKCFGASGTIVGDTIYYFGGASAGNNFSASAYMRKGIINPNDPTQIIWSSINLSPNLGYRTACKKVGEYICFIGGSDVTYNYNGIAYNGTGIVKPNRKCLWYHIPTQHLILQTNINVLQDYRGIADVNDTTAILVGGIDSNNNISNTTIQLSTTAIPTAIKNWNLENTLEIFPNPITQQFSIKTTRVYNKIELLNASGNVICNWKKQPQYLLPSGISYGNYFLKINIDKNTSVIKTILIAP